MLWVVLHVFATLTAWELGTCGRCPMCLLSTRNVCWDMAVQSIWQKGWSLGRGGSLASPSTSPSSHRCCFGDVRSLSCHFWTYPPLSLAKPFWAWLAVPVFPVSSRCLPPPVQRNPFFYLLEINLVLISLSAPSLAPQHLVSSNSKFDSSIALLIFQTIITQPSTLQSEVSDFLDTLYKAATPCT